METIMKMLKLIALLLLLTSPVVYGMNKDEKGSTNSNAAKVDQNDGSLEKKQQIPAPSINKLTLYIINEDLDGLKAAFAHPSFEAKDVKQQMLQKCLFTASECGRSEVVKMLITLGADVKTCKHVLHAAIRHGNKDCMQILVDHGADIEDKISNYDDMWTPLHSAAQRGATSLVSILLVQGANLEVETNTHDGETAFEHAAVAVRNQKDCIRLLLFNGATKKRTMRFNSAIRGLENVIESALIDREKLLAFYGDPKLCGNYKTRNVVITNCLTMLTTLPIELVKLILAFDICIFTLETIIPSDKDLALIKDKSNQ